MGDSGLLPSLTLETPRTGDPVTSNQGPGVAGGALRSASDSSQRQPEVRAEDGIVPTLLPWPLVPPAGSDEPRARPAPGQAKIRRQTQRPVSRLRKEGGTLAGPGEQVQGLSCLHSPGGVWPLPITLKYGPGVGQCLL